jgi:hypothetical protein
VSDALQDLATREGTAPTHIGFVDVGESRSSEDRHVEQRPICETVGVWCRENGFSGAVWTALRPNFQEETNAGFSVEAAVNYLRNLPKGARTVALHYIRSAPEEVITPLRTAVNASAFD